MLDPQEKAAFDGMTTQLRADDPGFSRKLDRIGKPRRRARMTTAILLWTLAPLMVFYGGWTGLIIALVAAVYGSILFSRRHQNMSHQPWTTSRGRRPGAAPSV